MGFVKDLFGGGNKTPTPTADTSPTTAATDAAKNQGKLNPLIMTSAAGATDPYQLGKKLLLGQ